MYKEHSRLTCPRREGQCLFADCRAATECSMLEPRATGDIAGTGVWIRNADVGMMLLEC